MSIFKIIAYSSLLIFSGACTTNLENSQQYLLEGKKELAEESLLEHAQENSIATLSAPEADTGIDFLHILAQTNSPQLLTRVYDLKFTDLAPSKNDFISSGRFSQTILALARQRKMNDLKNKIAAQIEAEIPYTRQHSYDTKLVQFAKFAAIYRSANRQDHPNLSAYWSAFYHDKSLNDFQDIWRQSKVEKAESIHKILQENLNNRLKTNLAQIITVSDSKELSFIFEVEKEFHNKDVFNALREAMKTAISQGRTTEKVAAGEIALLKPQILKSSDRLFNLEAERRDLQSANNYTFEEKVSCKVCSGRGEVNCGTCRGRGVCRYCDRGYHDCNRCSLFHRGFIDCSRCRKRGYYKERHRVWDSCQSHYVLSSVRVTCNLCCGSGYVSCGCFNGRVNCRRCRGHFNCRTCKGTKVIDCITCRDGYIIEVRKTTAGQDIDTRVRAAQSEQSALLGRLNHLELLVRKAMAQGKLFLSFL